MDKLKDLALNCYCRLRIRGMDLKRRLQGQDGATTVEYVLLIAVIVIGIVSAATYMFDPLKEFFKGVVDKVKKFAGVK